MQDMVKGMKNKRYDFSSQITVYQAFLLFVLFQTGIILYLIDMWNIFINVFWPRCFKIQMILLEPLKNPGDDKPGGTKQAQILREKDVVVGASESSLVGWKVLFLLLLTDILRVSLS